MLSHGGQTAPAVWPRVWLLYACGLLAAAQLGKLSALAPWLTGALGLSLPVMAWAISLLEAGGATLALVSGRLAARLGLWRLLRAGVAGLALAGAAQALAQGPWTLLAARLLEALGYLGVIVTAPVLIAGLAAQAGGRVRDQAMALWSTFVPVGLALGAAGAAVTAGAWGWRAALAAGAAVAVVLAVALWRSGLPAETEDLPEPGPQPGRRAGPPPRITAGAAQGIVAGLLRRTLAGLQPGALALCLGFGLFAVFEVGMIALLPTLLASRAGYSATEAGFWTGVASAAAVLGSALGALLLRRGVPARWPMLLAIAGPALLLPGVFNPAPQPLAAVALSVALHAGGGVFASLVFARLPTVTDGSAGAMVRVNALLAQCGASGSLLGPPTMAAWVAAGGWWAGAAWGVAVSALALPLLWRATRGQGAGRA